MEEPSLQHISLIFMPSVAHPPTCCLLRGCVGNLFSPLWYGDDHGLYFLCCVVEVFWISRLNDSVRYPSILSIAALYNLLGFQQITQLHEFNFCISQSFKPPAFLTNQPLEWKLCHLYLYLPSWFLAFVRTWERRIPPIEPSNWRKGQSTSWP